MYIINNNDLQIFFYDIDKTIYFPKTSTSNLEPKALAAWAGDEIRASVTITNDFPYDVELVWSDEANEGIPQGVIPTGQSMIFSTFLGHTFFARNPASPNEILDYFVINGRSYSLNPQNRLESCESYEGDLFLQSKVCQCSFP